MMITAAAIFFGVVQHNDFFFRFNQKCRTIEKRQLRKAKLSRKKQPKNTLKINIIEEKGSQSDVQVGKKTKTSKLHLK